MSFESVRVGAGKEPGMDTFAAITLGGLLLALLVFLGIGYAWRGRPVEEITDRRQNERWAAQMKVEERDVPEMLAAANEYRRKRSLPEITPEEFSAKVEREQHELLRQAEKQMRARSSAG
jgi:hypothetical protein